MENHPILPTLIYFIQRGCSWDAANNAGKTASVILAEAGYPKEAIELLDAEAARFRRPPAGPQGCMGQDGNCASSAMFSLFCKHRVALNVCPGCMPVTFAQKRCKCGEDEITSIPGAIISQPLVKAELGENQTKLDILEWINDGSPKGSIQDLYGNKFICQKTNNRKNAPVGYRCVKVVELTQKRCPAVARRYLGPDGKQRSIVLEKPHADHSERRRDEPGPSSGIIFLFICILLVL